MDAKRKIPYMVMNCEKPAGEFAVAALSAAAAAARAGEVFERTAGTVWQDGVLIGDGALSAHRAATNKG